MDLKKYYNRRYVPKQKIYTDEEIEFYAKLIEVMYDKKFADTWYIQRKKDQKIGEWKTRQFEKLTKNLDKCRECEKFRIVYDDNLTPIKYECDLRLGLLDMLSFDYCVWDKSEMHNLPLRD